MKKILMSLLLGMIVLLSNVASAATVPVSDYSVDDFMAVCNRKANDLGKNIDISNVVNSPELSNIEGMDAWVSAVMRNPGSFVMTLQTKDDRIMAVFMTISIDSADKTNNTDENIKLAGDFLPALAQTIGLSEKEYNILLTNSFLENPTGAIWCEQTGRTIAYQCVVNEEWKTVYFMLMASDKKV